MAVLYANIIIDISHESVDRVFQYRIPETLEGAVRVGDLVEVPFGQGNRRRKGYVVEITDKNEYDVEKIKEVAGVAAGNVPVQSQLIQLAWWMKEQYGSTMNQALKTVLPVRQKVKARNKEIIKTILSGEVTAQPRPVLRAGQQEIVDSFCREYDQGERIPYLIHGITGSGKTEVYMELMEHVLRMKKQVIILIPEIALTYQTVMRFYQRFGDRLSVINSRLSAGERFDQFERARKGESDIMIGPRSALFAPFPRLGLIVMDEEHEGAYKSETTPRYHAREAAEKRAALSGAAFVMGSATPSLEAYTRAKAGFYRLFSLNERARKDSRLAHVQVVDLREELKEGNKSIFSRSLQALIQDRLERKEQIMLFMNRRGYSSFLSCRSCGEALRCPHCDVSLTVHNGSRLQCHYCGYTISAPKLCPSCGSPYLAGFGIGTQKIEEMTRAMYPSARVLRMDFDTTSKKGGHEAILSAFAKREADILIGTQMIVKGHDFPGVTLVGILAADISLYAPDYRCGERTFQLLTQAVGRAGRSEIRGDALIQTYAPDHYSIETAANQDYEAFYEREMSYRQLMSYPPAAWMLTVQFSSGLEPDLDRAITAAVNAVRQSGEEMNLKIIGPVCAPVYKVNDIYRKILYMKQKNYDILIRIRKLLEQATEDAELFRNVMVQYDFS